MSVTVTANATALVRTMAFLHTIRRERGLAPSVEMSVPAEGVSARVLAAELGLPVDMIEGVFHNHVLREIDTLVRPGDRVLFLPYGTPATHPAFFGPPKVAAR